MEQLVYLRQEVDKINAKVQQALSIRQRLIERISGSCKILIEQPMNEKAQRSLTLNLGHEKRFLDIIRIGSKNGLVILKETRRVLKQLEIEHQTKEDIREVILNLIDIMRFTRKKIGLIEARAALGKTLGLKRFFIFGQVYPRRRLEKFVENLEKEIDLDAELALRLEGKLLKLLPHFQRLKRDLRLAIPAGILGGAVAGTPVYGYTVYSSGSWSPDETAKLLITAASICFGVICLIQGICTQERRIAQEEKEVIQRWRMERAY